MKRVFSGFLALFIGIGLVGTSVAAPATGLYGLGATFPEPLYNKMFAAYQKATGIPVAYDPGGSGKGQKEILARTIDFGGTDIPMAPDVMATAPGKILHIPTAIGAIAVAYTIPNLNQTLKLDGPTLADIYLGKIKTWNDPRIAKLNAGVTLPNLAIRVLYREEASGTTRVLTDYLSKVSPEWKTKVGESGTPKWPVGEGAKGNEGLTYALKTVPGGIAYVEQAYAKANKLRTVALKNRAGKFVLPDNGPAEDAADDKVLPADLKVSLTDSAVSTAYPIVSFTYLMFYQDQKYGGRTPVQAKQLRDLLNWMVTDGQAFNQGLDYGKLPAGAVKRAQAIISTMTYGGQKF